MAKATLCASSRALRARRTFSPSCPRAVADLKGKTVAGPKGTVLHQLLAAALAREGMSVQQVNFVQMDLPQAFAAVQSGKADAALLAANFVLNAQKDGAHVLARATGLLTPLLTMTASEKFLKAHPRPRAGRGGRA